MKTPLSSFGARALAGSAIFLVALLPARAAVFFNNLDQPIESTAGLDDDYLIGQSFLTDSSSLYFKLDSVTLSMAAGDASGGAIQIRLYSDDANAPDVALELLSGAAAPLVAGNYTYTSSGYSLAPNTLYWIVATGLNTNGTYEWNYTNSTVTSGAWTTSGWTDMNISGNSGWNLIDPTAPQMLSLSATGVPEPATWAIITGGVAFGLAVFRRRRA